MRKIVSSIRRGAIQCAPAFTLIVLLILAVPAAAQDTTGQEGAGAQEQTSLTIADNLLDRSFSAYDAENYDQALLDVSLYVLLNPTATQGYYVRALVQAARQQPEEALDDLDRALVLAEGDLYGVQYRAGLLSTRASIRQWTGDVEGALVDYAAALEVAPSADSYRGRAFLYAQQGDFEEALADIDAAIALTPEEQAGGLYLARASVNERAGDVETAAADYLTYVQSIATDVLNEDVIVSDEIRELEMVPGRVYTLPFQANRGDILTAAAAADEAGGVDALLILITTEGEPLVANDDRAADDLSAVIGEYSIPATDTYVLLLTHSGGGSSGTVRVVINLQPPT